MPKEKSFDRRSAKIDDRAAHKMKSRLKAAHGKLKGKQESRKRRLDKKLFS
jgi:hypothetical protein